MCARRAVPGAGYAAGAVCGAVADTSPEGVPSATAVFKSHASQQKGSTLKTGC